MKIKSVLNQNLFIDYDILYDTGDNIFRSMARADEMLQELSGLMGRAEALVFRVPEEVRHALLQNSCAKVKGEIRGIDLNTYGLKASRSLYALADQSQSVDREVAENLLDKKEVMRFLRQEVDGLTQMAAFRNYRDISVPLLMGSKRETGNVTEDTWNPIKTLSEMMKIYERETFDVMGKPFSTTYQAAIFSGITMDANGVPIINSAVDAENYMKIMRLSLCGEAGDDVTIYRNGNKYTFRLSSMTFDDAVDAQYNLKDDSLQVVYYDANDKRPASREEIYRYMNPLNYMKGDNIYQFIDLSYDEERVISLEKARELLAGQGVLEGQEKVFLKAGEQGGVDPQYLIGHAILETGNGTSELAVGIKYTPDDGRETKKVYNMFGIGATDDDPTKKGAKKAYELEWYLPETAIIGGATYIGENYVKKDQEPKKAQKTLYEMRWNSINPATHQYSTDVGWAIKQISSQKMDQIYADTEEGLQFCIPVYMSERNENR